MPTELLIGELADAADVGVESRIRDLKRVRLVLHDLVEACANRAGTTECPILEVLDDHEPGDEETSSERT